MQDSEIFGAMIRDVIDTLEKITRAVDHTIDLKSSALKRPVYVYRTPKFGLSISFLDYILRPNV